MGTLVIQTPYSEVTATLELLDRWGVTRNGLKDFRKATSRIHREVALLIQGGEVVSVSPPPFMSSPFFADEERESDYGYPPGFAVRSIPEQLLKLAPHFPNLDPEPALHLSRSLPDLSFIPEVWMGREVRRWVNWYAVPRWERGVSSSGGEAVEKVLEMLASTRFVYNPYKGAFGPEHLRITERTVVALRMLSASQKGDYLLIPAQFGFSHRGRSARRVRVVYAPHEFGLGSFITGCMLLSHPERLVEEADLHICCPGEEYHNLETNGGSSLHAPFFRFFGGKVWFEVRFCGDADDHYSSASAFFPPKLV
ncbi:hypothetical protein A3A38_04915 [Candidatus Kaiserbacteria bacterium RIFCSPLOWO2_01_FULL_53_17]|uniref:Uncharacterized protein n=1 Tax=Candidatus Kaiserbacteria bacterium RIFCSPLOWO2_01_FULL_53_17 TaxID=1798511 RepID=A0A1F6EGX3_9BACT|nr:MAG: hypothetical protein A3A38_04915 [Candidatus Kaiserbacteria bacterium RIFCSPLOWO2_01_FULL_53_17]